MRVSGGHSALKKNTRAAVNTIGPSAPATKPTTAAVAITNACFIAIPPKPNVPDQWLAAKGLSTPQGFIASPLHRVVLLSA
jgi:hypothetical protein